MQISRTHTVLIALSCLQYRLVWSGTVQYKIIFVTCKKTNILHTVNCHPQTLLRNNSRRSKHTWCPFSLAHIFFVEFATVLITVQGERAWELSCKGSLLKALRTLHTLLLLFCHFSNLICSTLQFGSQQMPGLRELCLHECCLLVGVQCWSVSSQIWILLH